jgi:hypothetical protein
MIAHAMEATMTRRYQLRIFDGQYEVLHRQVHTVVLDLDSPAADGILDRQLVALTRQAEAANEPMDAPRLEVWAGDVKVLDWAG